MGIFHSTSFAEAAACCTPESIQQKLKDASSLPSSSDSPFFRNSSGIRELTDYQPQQPGPIDTLVALLDDGHSGQILYSRLSRLAGQVPLAILEAWAALADQCVRVGIDYRTLGLGWQHPDRRILYRTGDHASFQHPASRKRAAASRDRLSKALLQASTGDINEVVSSFEEGLVREFLIEISAPASVRASTPGVAAALHAELVQPLRALNEGKGYMQRTYIGQIISPQYVAEAIRGITEAVTSRPGGFSAWRYSNPMGIEQLRGLTREQTELWQQPFSLAHRGGLTTHEDDSSELGLFWATKIGGPSHGFDYEAQCLLPLLCNARHKALLVDDAGFPDHPCGRAHFRLLWALPSGNGFHPHGATGGPRLWLEALHYDFEAVKRGLGKNFLPAVLRHAMTRSCALQAPLLVDVKLMDKLQQAAADFGGEVRINQERLILRPSNGVVEASDYLSKKHDWVNLEEELTDVLQSAMFVPPQSPFDPIVKAAGWQSKSFGNSFASQGQAQQTSRSAPPQSTYQMQQAGPVPLPSHSYHTNESFVMPFDNLSQRLSQFAGSR